MTSVAASSSSWFPDAFPPTGAPGSLHLISRLVTFGTFGALIGAGTAGYDNLTAPHGRNTEASYISAARLPISVALPKHSSGEVIERVRSMLHLNMSAFARLMGVSRQTVYNWRNGEALSTDYSEKLDDLSAATELMASVGIQVSGLLLKRKFIDGKTLLDVVQSGGSATTAAQLLIGILQREQQQRDMLNARYAARRSSSPAPDADLPAPND